MSRPDTRISSGTGSRPGAGDAAPTLLTVLRQAHLGMAVGGVAIVGASLVLPAAIALHVSAQNDLNLAAHAMRYTTEAAVVFRDREAAREALMSIASTGDIAEASVYDADGKLLASWHNTSRSMFATLSEAAAALLQERATTVPVVHDGKIIGQVRARGSGQTLLGFLLAGAAGIATCQFLLVIGALYLSRRILARIARPLEALTQIAQTVRRHRSSADRVPAAGIAELHDLGETFNALFDELDTWQALAQSENARLSHKAHHDSLTGLPNRAFFEERLDRDLQDAEMDGSSVAVLFLDSDGFKQINDRLGHATGDEVLVSTATRVRKLLRDEDLVVRLGGDEFAVLLPRIQGSAQVAQIARGIEDSVGSPLKLRNGETISTSVSIGIAIFPEQAQDATALLHVADVDMYRVKRSRRAGFEAASSGVMQDGIADD